MTSELPIVGPLPAGWAAVPFGSLLLGGKSRNGLYKPKEFHGSGAKIVNMGELFGNPRLGDITMKRLQVTDDELEKFSVRKGDLLFARRSLVAEGAGKVCLVVEASEDTVFESSIIRARPNDAASSVYLYYLFRSPFGAHVLDTIRRHVAVAGIAGSDLVNLVVPRPPLSEQRRIADVLSVLDDKIELNRKVNKTLEQMAQASFKSWFIDFDDHTEFEDSELGRIPKGWRVDGLLSVAELVSGGTPKTSEAAYWGGSLNWASAKDVSNAGAPFLLETERTITERGLRESSTKMVPRHATVVVARGATTGRFTMLAEPMAMNQTCYALVSRRAVPLYFNQLFRQTVRSIVHAAHGSVFDTITTRTLEGARVLVPPESRVRHYETTTVPVLARVEANLREEKTLAALRDTLLPRLISGELRVRDAENAVEVVA